MTPNPFKTIWTRPRQTVYQITSENPALHVTLLVCLEGIGSALDRAASRNLGDKFSLLAILLIAFVLGPVGGIIKLWIFSHLIRLTGSWMGGLGNRQHIKTAIAWGCVPITFSLVLYVPLLLVLGEQYFQEHTGLADEDPTMLLGVGFLGLLQFALAIWSMILVSNTIAEVQGFRSAWEGLANLVLAGVLFLLPFIIFFVAVSLLR